MKSCKILLNDNLGGMKEVRARKEKLRDQYHSTLEVLQARKTALESELNHVSYGLLCLYQDQWGGCLMEPKMEIDDENNHEMKIHYDKL